MRKAYLSNGHIPCPGFLHVCLAPGAYVPSYPYHFINGFDYALVLSSRVRNFHQSRRCFRLISFLGRCVLNLALSPFFAGTILSIQKDYPDSPESWGVMGSACCMPFYQVSAGDGRLHSYIFRWLACQFRTAHTPGQKCSSGFYE